MKDDIFLSAKEDTEDNDDPNGEDLVPSPHGEENATPTSVNDDFSTDVVPSVPRGRFQVHHQQAVTRRSLM